MIYYNNNGFINNPPWGKGAAKDLRGPPRGASWEQSGGEGVGTPGVTPEYPHGYLTVDTATAGRLAMLRS